MRGQVRDIVEGMITNASGNVQEGQAAFSKLFDEALETKKIDPNKVSLLELFNALCDPDNKINRSNVEQVMEAVHSSVFPYITGKLISSKVLEAYNLNIAPVQMLYTEISMSRKEEDLAGFTDLDTPDEVPEGLPYTETAIGEKVVKIKAKKFGRIISLTREAIMFDQTGQLLDRASRIGEKMAYVEAKAVIQACMDAANTDLGVAATDWWIYNGTARDSYANTHATVDGRVNDNIITATLGTAGLKEAYKYLALMQDLNGEYINVIPKVLIVPANKKWDAMELLTSDKQYDSAENAKNVFMNEGLKIFSHPIVDATSAYYWYLGDFAKDIYLGRVWPVEVTAQGKDSDAAFTSDIVKRYKVSDYFGVNAVDYRHRLVSQATS